MARPKAPSVAPTVAVGDVDPMSLAARKSNLPLCGERDVIASYLLYCSRAKGHDDSREGPAAMHVATWPNGVVVAVWA
jgi:hypothetical protein